MLVMLEETPSSAESLTIGYIKKFMYLKNIDEWNEL